MLQNILKNKIYEAETKTINNSFLFFNIWEIK